MLRSLYARLSVAMITIIAVVGGGFVVISQITTTLYYEELTQRLNAPIAMYVTGQQTLLLPDGTVDEAALKTLAQRAMIINPAVEVYLLDAGGRILAHDLPPDSVHLESVAIQPIKDLIGGDVDMPFKGDDPRNPRVKKIFSASEVRVDDDLRGYLYVVLGGQKYDELVGTLRGSYARDLGFWAIVALLALGSAVGLLAFGLLTKRLRKLTTVVQQLSDSDFEMDIRDYEAQSGADEIDQLDRSFRAMAVRISELVERLKETDRLRRELISNVSHDLRTPLASMQGYIETLLIKNGSISEQERERCLRIARKNTQRLSELVDDLFELSKLDSATVIPAFETFSLAELLQDTVQEFELDASSKGITMETATPADSATVYADIGLIQRVLENLLKNAIHFTPSGGRIRIAIEKRPETVAVSVSDTGCGIAEADLDKIFDRFYRHESGDEKQSGSTGLGLAIVKRILDLHESRITVTSDVDRGTRFEFDLQRIQKAA
ncbi:MAG: HAMP domain-containing histidine kinase [Gammaproteobacteria bacterium]|nr:HAMP domain-containing histidine kinase [Gammaproteobacteria bacterium]MDH3428660.1 HAMP domain-containing histidine kinase [Gammaproteobacteria bacterium]